MKLEIERVKIAFNPSQTPFFHIQDRKNECLQNSRDSRIGHFRPTKNPWIPQHAKASGASQHSPPFKHDHTHSFVQAGPQCCHASIATSSCRLLVPSSTKRTFTRCPAGSSRKIALQCLHSCTNKCQYHHSDEPSNWREHGECCSCFARKLACSSTVESRVTSPWAHSELQQHGRPVQQR